MMFGGTIGENLLTFFRSPWIDYAFSEYLKEVYEIKGEDIHNQRIIEYLKSAGIVGDDLKDETAWCASFVHWCLKQVGIVGAGPGGKDWKTWGKPIDSPAYGAIAIFNSSHVGFVVGQNGNRLIILHGNWSNQLHLSTYIKPTEIQMYRYPINYYPLTFFNF